MTFLSSVELEAARAQRLEERREAFAVLVELLELALETDAPVGIDVQALPGDAFRELLSRTLPASRRTDRPYSTGGLHYFAQPAAGVSVRLHTNALVGPERQGHGSREVFEAGDTVVGPSPASKASRQQKGRPSPRRESPSAN